MTRVKICGINSEPAIDAAVAAGADWIGFVFAKSPRRVTPARAEALSLRHPGGPLRVGLFVNPTDTDIEDALDAVPLDVLQIYGDPARAAALRTAFGITVWHAIGIASAADLPQAADGVDGFVLDAPPPPAADRPGGHGAAFDWPLLRGWAAPAPWLLAGGLNPANVASAIAISGATAVDVSSGVERESGVKDPALIAAFVAAARRITET